jgi:AAA domain-containing protein
VSDWNRNPFAGSAGDGGRFHPVKFRDVPLRTQARCLIKDLIPRDSLVLVWGPPKCGKSFWVFDLVMHVALGREYRGRRVEQGAVVYIAAEGETGIRARLHAFWQRRLADSADPPFWLLTTRLDLVEDIDELIGELGAALPDGCSVLVIDTLNRTIHGSETGTMTWVPIATPPTGCESTFIAPL